VTSPNLRADIYDPRTLAAMDQAFAAAWRITQASKIDEMYVDLASSAYQAAEQAVVKTTRKCA
jgi:hypothetical protein